MKTAAVFLLAALCLGARNCSEPAPQVIERYAEELHEGCDPLYARALSATDTLIVDTYRVDHVEPSCYQMRTLVAKYPPQ